MPRYSSGTAAAVGSDGGAGRSDVSVERRWIPDTDNSRAECDGIVGDGDMRVNHTTKRQILKAV